MSKDFALTTDGLFGSYCYIEQKRYGVPNEKFLYKIIGKFTSNAWSNVPVDANDKEPHIFNHSEEVINVVCCGVCEDKIERYKLSDVEIISNKDQQFDDLEAKLAESEKSKESYRLQNEHHHLQLLQFYSRLGVEAFGADIHEKALETLMIMKEQLAEKDKEISEYIKIVDDLHKQLSDKCDFCDKTKDQDKISFAVEQLEKVKEIINKNYFYNLSNDSCTFDKLEVDFQINNQIKQLNEGK